jgi:AcrR family transcriptional regulator
MERPMSENTDPRAIRTREALVSAFRDLVQEQHPGEMTVAALCRAAGINRSTFYQHFSSPEDLAVHAFGDLFDAVVATDIALRPTTTPLDASRQAIAGIVGFVAAHRSTYASLLGPGAPPALYRAIVSTYAEHSVDAIRLAPGRPEEADPLVTAQYLAGGVLGALGRWLVEPDRSEAALVDALVACLPGWLTGS